MVRAVQRKGSYIIETELVDQDGEKQISFIRVINDIGTQKMIGALIINLDAKELLGKNINHFETVEETCIFSEDGNIIAGEWENEKLPFRELPAGDLIVREQDYVMIAKPLAINNWILVKRELIESFTADISRFITLVILCLCVFLVFLIAGTYFIARTITEPIQRLTKAMTTAKDKNFELLDIEAQEDEIGRLAQGFNLMNKEISELIKSLIQQEKNAKKAELAVMQEQIKPHFLYNTLDAIAAMALTSERENVYRAIESLGSYYRNSLSHGNETTTLEKEMKIAEDYLALQKLRYGDLFEDEL